MAAPKGLTLRELVERFGGELRGDGACTVSRVATLASAGPDAISFLTNPRYRAQLARTRAAAVIVGPDDAEVAGRPCIVSANPYAYVAKVSALFHPPRGPRPGIHPSATVDASAELPGSCEVGAQAVVGARVRLGERVVIGAGVVIGEDVTIGDDSRLYPGVVIYHGCRLGARVTVHSGAVIGADGFGLAREGGRWLKMPQVGGVTIGDDVEIGANTTIDRGAFDDTVIEEGVKLDNQIQVAHNVRIGAHTAIAGCVGIAGSAVIGRHCMIGGAANIHGHIEIADGTVISACTLVTKSITVPGTYTAMWAAQPHRAWLQQVAQLRQVETLRKRVRELEQRLQRLEGDGA